MNKKAIAGILARLDDPDQIETLLELIANKADEPPATSEPIGQLFSISDTTPQRRAVKAPNARKGWPVADTQRLLEMKAAGYTRKAIAYHLGRSEKAVSDRLYRMKTGEVR